MALIYPKTIRWSPSPASDVAAYRVYFEKDPIVVSYSSPFVEVAVDVTALSVPNDNTPYLKDQEGVWNIGVTAVDEGGNESDFLLGSSNLDFLPPAPPTNLLVE